MATPADITGTQDHMLGELADLAMDLARNLAAKAKAADTPEGTERFTLAFERMARSVRLSISLQRRLGREARRDLGPERTEAVQLRQAQIRAAVRAVIRDESGLKDYDVRRVQMERELDERLAEETLYEAFLETPLDLAITQLRHALGLPSAEPAANDGLSHLEKLGDSTPSVGFADSSP